MLVLYAYPAHFCTLSTEQAYIISCMAYEQCIAGLFLVICTEYSQLDKLLMTSINIYSILWRHDNFNTNKSHRIWCILRTLMPTNITSNNLVSQIRWQLIETKTRFMVTDSLLWGKQS